MKNHALSLAIIISLLFAPAAYAVGKSGDSYAIAVSQNEKNVQKPQDKADQKAKTPGDGMATPGEKGSGEPANKESKNPRIKKVEHLRGKKVTSWQVLNH
jgi:hypothetical protein